MHDVFICYATEDTARVNKVVAELEAKGLRCWMAPRDIGAGSNFQHDIIDAIDNARAMIVMMSRAMNASEECINEITVAKGIGSDYRLIPVRLYANVKPDRGYRYYLASPQWIEYHADPNGAADAIFATLGIEQTSAGGVARLQATDTESSQNAGALVEKEKPAGKANKIPKAWDLIYLMLDWNGRIDRRMYLAACAIHLIVITPLLLLAVVAVLYALQSMPFFGAAASTVLIFLFYWFWFFTGTAMHAKRIHDLSRSAWKILIIPLISILLGTMFAVLMAVFENTDTILSSLFALGAVLLWLLVPMLGWLFLLVYPGAEGENRFGTKPRYSKYWQPYDPTLRIASASPEYELSFLLLRTKGRIGRAPFAMGLLFVIWLGLFYAYADFLSGTQGLDTLFGSLPNSLVKLESGMVLLGSAAVACCVYCLFAIVSKRLHDLGQSSWWSVLIISVLLTIVLAIEEEFVAQDFSEIGRVLTIMASLALLSPLMIIRGAPDFNRHGPPPGFKVEALRVGNMALGNATVAG